MPQTLNRQVRPLWFGAPVPEIARRLRVSQTAVYGWRKRRSAVDLARCRA
ncbi:helix-turn-helix domain-containing protein [Micromonospora sp. R77]|nr:helix-turn-helix domain-containing protein [Micromonospora sp. R77]MCI4061384.1 helix-turn-helix domain-containing protein [Micromonospora sp. R77]